MPRLAILLAPAADVAVPVTGRLGLPAAGGDRDLAPAPALFVARTGDRDRVLGAVGDLARIAAARALVALVIRTGDLDLDLAVLLLKLVVRIGDLERPLLRAFVAVAGPSKVEVEVVAEADLVVRRIGDLDLVLLAVVLFLVIPLPTPMPSLSISLLVKDLALALDLDLGTTTGRFGES